MKNATDVPEIHFHVFIHCFVNIGGSDEVAYAQAGRSTYVSAEILSSVPDPGAMAAASWYRAAALVVKEKYKS